MQIYDVTTIIYVLPGGKSQSVPPSAPLVIKPFHVIWPGQSDRENGWNEWFFSCGVLQDVLIIHLFCSCYKKNNVIQRKQVSNHMLLPICTNQFVNVLWAFYSRVQFSFRGVLYEGTPIQIGDAIAPCMWTYGAPSGIRHRVETMVETMGNIRPPLLSRTRPKTASIASICRVDRLICLAALP